VPENLDRLVRSGFILHTDLNLLLFAIVGIRSMDTVKTLQVMKTDRSAKEILGGGMAQARLVGTRSKSPKENREILDC